MKLDKKQLCHDLFSWYEKSHRQLPWREDITAYKVWISEIMLQQTRVEAVKSYYQRFMKEVPTVFDLAKINDEKLLKLWEGLGYYSRARNLKKAAFIIVEKYGGRIPDTYNELITLPGIGDYTAGAILSIAYQKSYPALDGNVFRVLTRVFENGVDILSSRGKKEIKDLLLQILPEQNCSLFTQAMMELGATVCIPNGNPHCEKCPFSCYCLSHLHHKELLYPVKKSKKQRKIERRYVFLITYRDKVLIQKRKNRGLLANFYEFPNVLVTDDTIEVDQFLKKFPSCEVEEIGDYKHIFTHIEWHMIGYLLKVSEQGEGIWATLEQLEYVYPIPNAFMKYKQKLKDILK